MDSIFFFLPDYDQTYAVSEGNDDSALTKFPPQSFLSMIQPLPAFTTPHLQIHLNA